MSTSTCRSILLRLIFIKLFGNENVSGEKDSGKVLIIIIILFLIIIIFCLFVCLFIVFFWGGERTFLHTNLCVALIFPDGGNPFPVTRIPDTFTSGADQHHDTFSFFVRRGGTALPVYN